MSKVAITGSNGTVGRALVPRLRVAHEIIPIDLPDVDILDPEKLRKALSGADVVLHLAGVFGSAAAGEENWLSPHQNPVNKKLFEATLTASKNANAKLFIHASSIHVEDSLGFMLNHPGELLVARPDVFATESPSGYSQSKREQEAIVKANAGNFAHGAVSIRLGGVTPTGLPLARHSKPDVLEHERRAWLNHDDLGDLVLRIIDQKSEPDYDVVFAVSDNTGRFHDVTNQYGWVPQANSSEYLR